MRTPPARIIRFQRSNPPVVHQLSAAQSMTRAPNSFISQWSVGRSRPKALHNKPPSLIHSIKLSRGNNTKSSNNYKPVTTLAPRKLRSTRPHSGARRQDILHQTFTTFALLSMSLQPPFLAAQRRRSTGFFTFYNLSSLSLSPSV